MGGRHEFLADLLVQAVGLVASLAGIVAMLSVTAPWADGAVLAAGLIYGATLVAMFVCSILNTTVSHPKRRIIVRLLDHSMIYLLIAGTYTPFCLLAMGGRQGALLLVGVWAGAAIGVIARTLLHRRVERAMITFYLVLGWSGLISLAGLIHRLTAPVVVLLVVGGLLYTIGAPIHRWSHLRYHSAIWHGCVVAAAGCHYSAILLVMSAFHRPLLG
jgi:hemolysin III